MQHLRQQIACIHLLDLNFFIRLIIPSVNIILNFHLLAKKYSALSLIAMKTI